MQTSKKLLSMSLALAMVLMSGCGGGGKDNSSSPTADKASTTVSESATPDDEQFINSFVASDPQTLDPQKGSDVYGNTIIVNTFEPLLRLKEKGDATEIVNAAAEDYTISDDGLTYTFTLRDGLKWDDGKDLTAKDYEYGIKRTADPNTGAESAFLLAPIKNFSKVNNPDTNTPIDELGVKAIDDKTLEITLEEPTEYFIRLVPFRVMCPQRQDIIEKYGDTYGSEAEGFVGCGPYKLTSWVHNSQLELEKSDTYWNKDNVKNDKVTIKVLGDINARMNSFQAKEVDRISTNKEEWNMVFDKDENVKGTKVSVPAIDYMILNHNDKLLSNAKIRQALNLAFDRQAFNDTFFKGKNTNADFWVPPSIDLYGTNFRKAAGDPLENLRANTKQTPKDLFIEGMKELGLGDDPSTVTIDFICVTDPEVKKYGEFIQQTYKKELGININLEVMEWAILSGRVNSGDFQMGYLAWTADYNDPSAMLSLFLSDANSVNTGWKSDEYDKLVLDAMKEKDQEKALDLYKQAEQLLFDESVIIPVTSAETTNYWQSYLQNVQNNQFDTMGYQGQFTSGRP